MQIYQAEHLTKHKKIKLGSYYTPENIVQRVYDFIQPYLLDNEKKAVIFDETYWLQQTDDGIFAIDMRFGLTFKTFTLATTSMEDLMLNGVGLEDVVFNMFKILLWIIVFALMGIIKFNLERKR